MKPLPIILFYLSVIITFILLLHSNLNPNPNPTLKNINILLLFWVIIGVLIIIYVGYIIIHRYEMKPRDANKPNYWDDDSYDLLSSSVWIDGYKDYMTQLDERYFTPDDNNVYLIEYINLAFTLGIILTTIPIFFSSFNMKLFLIGQILISVYYLWTIPKRMTMSMTRGIEYVYFGISSIWVVYPLMLLILILYSNSNSSHLNFKL